jgi:putative ABC transport system permease protein
LPPPGGRILPLSFAPRKKRDDHVSGERNILRRVTGMGAAASIAFALLAGGTVLAATAGPRVASATGTRALQQTVGQAATVNRTITVTSSWSQRYDALENGTEDEVVPNLTPAESDAITAQLRRDFAGGPLPLTPQPADWLAMSPDLYPVAPTPAPPGLDGIPAELEVAYRDPAAGHLRLVAGSMPDTAPAPVSTSTAEDYDLEVVVTPQTASRFSLRTGSELTLNGPPQTGLSAGKLTLIRLHVTGIFEPADPGSAFWQSDPLLPAPVLDRVGDGEIWDAAVLADPGEFDVMQQMYGGAGLRFQWELPVDSAGLHSQARALESQVNQTVSRAPKMTGPLAPLANALTVTWGLAQPLAVFTAAAADVNVLLWIVYAGLAVAGLVTLLLAGQMIAGRRSAELAQRRARGASLWQLFWLGAGGAAVSCVPAAAAGWAAGVLLVPGPAGPSGLAAVWPGLAALAVAVGGPGAVAAWQHRLPRRSGGRRRWPWLPRVVLEATACAAAIGAVTVFRRQTGAADLFASLAPVLVAVPAVILALRLEELLLRALARASARRRGVTGFLGLARAARAPLLLALPAMTLVLALTVAAFTGMVRAAVVRGETAVSWQAAGADVTVAAASQPGLSPAAVRALTAVPGVRQAAAVRTVALSLDSGQVVTVAVVDPAGYAALTAAAPGFAPLPAALLTAPPGQGTVTVLASPQAAAELSGQAGGAIVTQGGLPTLRVRVAGLLPSTPAFPAGGAFIVLPQSALGGASAPPPVNLMLLTGPSIDLAKLRAAVRSTVPVAVGLTVTTRSAVLQGLTGAPLQQGTFLLFALAIGYAAALALAVMLLELAVGSADRELTTARLATMGLSEGQRVRLVALEVVPPIVASAVAAAGCALALPRLLAPAVNLSEFTRTQAPVPLGTDFAAFLLPLAALLVITVIALAWEIRSGRGRGSAVTMRT